MAKKKETQKFESDSDELQFRCNKQLPKKQPQINPSMAESIPKKTQMAIQS